MQVGKNLEGGSYEIFESIVTAFVGETGENYKTLRQDSQ
jgi:hypothetical protein